MCFPNGFSQFNKLLQVNAFASKKAKGFGSDNKSNNPRCAVGLLFIYSDKTGATLNRECICPVSNLCWLLKPMPKSRRNLMDKSYFLVVYLPVCYEHGLNDIDTTDQYGICDARLIGTASEMVQLETVVPQIAISKESEDTKFFIRSWSICSIALSTANIRQFEIQCPEWKGATFFFSLHITAVTFGMSKTCQVFTT